MLNMLHAVLPCTCTMRVVACH